MKFRQTIPDNELLRLVKSHDAISYAFANVRPTDDLMTLARKTLAWAEKGSPL